MSDILLRKSWYLLMLLRHNDSALTLFFLLLADRIVLDFTLSTVPVCLLPNNLSTLAFLPSSTLRYRRPSIFHVGYPRLLLFAFSRRNDCVGPALLSLELALTKP